MSDGVKVIQDFVAAIGAGDFEKAIAMLSPDLVIYHTTRLPYAGRYHGRDGFGQLLEKIGAFWEKFEPLGNDRFVEHGDAVVVVGGLRGKPHHRDEWLTIPAIERYEVKDGLITRLWPFYIDTDLTEEQIRP